MSILRYFSSQDRKSKQLSIASVSSHIPQMTTGKNDENLFLTQALATMSATPDLESFLQAIPMTTSESESSEEIS